MIRVGAKSSLFLGGAGIASSPTTLWLSQGSQRRVARGFSMLELLAVLALIALFYGLSVPMLGKGQGTSEQRAAARQVAAALKQARNQAVNERGETTVVFDLAAKSFLVKGKTHEIPKSVGITLDTTQKELISETKGAIRFYPDGGSTGGRVTLKLRERSLQIDVDWLTGRVTVDEKDTS